MSARQRAPRTGGSFKYLADKGFYDNLTFHRMVAGFVIQGGDPAGSAPPSVDAGLDKGTHEGDTVQLAASASGFGPFSYTWRQVSGTPVQFTTDGNVLTFTAPKASGTEPLIRVMVEAPEKSQCAEIAARLAETVERELA